MFGTNCKGAFLLSHAAAEVTIVQGGGRINTLATVGAERGGAGTRSDHSKRAALKALSASMAAEWARCDTSASAVEPGLARTRFSRPIWGHAVRAEKRLSAVPRGRVTGPDEIVGAALFLAPDADHFVTTQSANVDVGSVGT